jgi:hypothetical protein
MFRVKTSAATQGMKSPVFRLMEGRVLFLAQLTASNAVDVALFVIPSFKHFAWIKKEGKMRIRTAIRGLK